MMHLGQHGRDVENLVVSAFGLWLTVHGVVSWIREWSRERAGKRAMHRDVERTAAAAPRPACDRGASRTRWLTH